MLSHMTPNDFAERIAYAQLVAEPSPPEAKDNAAQDIQTFLGD